jgi:hypothetical protein
LLSMSSMRSMKNILYQTAIRVFREGKLPFPDGNILAKVAWNAAKLPRVEREVGLSESSQFHDVSLTGRGDRVSLGTVNGGHIYP